MQPASTHFDAVLGIDFHMVVVPGSPVPVLMPTPFVGMVLDVMDYLPGLGATVKINGRIRATAGTGVVTKHVPIGGVFLKPPANEGELFMGSATVTADGDPLGRAMVPVLTCQDIGIPAPPRLSKLGAPRSMLLPTSRVIPVPSGHPVLVGGPPTIDIMGLAMKAVGPLAKRLRGAFYKSARGAGVSRVMKGASDYLNGHADRIFKSLGLSLEGKLRNTVKRRICTLTGHPVDVATGKVFTDFVDLTLPGPLPFEVERVWFSCSDYDGPLGHGWHLSFDMALVADTHAVGVRLGDGRVVLFPVLAVGESHFHLGERLTLVRDSLEYRLLDVASGQTHHFVDGKLTRLEDRNAFSVLFRHEHGHLREIVDSGGRSWTLHWNSGRIAALEGPHPDTVGSRVVYQRYRYDAAGNLAAAEDALGYVQRFAYRDHLLVRETLKSGVSFQFEYDAQKRCVRTWGDGGIYDHKLTYDPNFNLTTVENSLGHKTQYEHDGAMVHRTLDAFGNEKRTEFGEGYRVLCETDELGQQTSHEYDARGNLTRTTLPDGATIVVEYAGDHVVAASDAIGGAWSWTRDSRGRALTCTNPLGETTRSEYSGRWLVASVDAAGGRTSLQHDDAGNVVAVVDANGALTRYEHDLLGRTLAITVCPRQATSRQRDRSDARSYA